MAKVKVFNMAHEEVGSLTLKDNVFGVEYNEPLIHEAIVIYNANQRQGTKSALSRDEVRGGKAKPWRQKHTGRARHGSTVSPEYTGGGVVFAPKPRDFSKKMNKNAKRVAFASALSQKLQQKELIVIDDFKSETGKTKDVKNFLKAFDLNRSVVIAVDKDDENVLRATKNMKNVTLANADLLNIYEVVSSHAVVLTKGAVKSIEEAYQE